MLRYSLMACLVTATLFHPSTIRAQGCSDAGFCTVNSFKPSQSSAGKKEFKQQVKTGVFVGTADLGVSVYGSYVEYHRQWTKKFGLDARLTSLGQRGNAVSTFGLADVLLTGTFQASKRVSITTGVKVPLMNGGKSLNNLPLPMDYQASLGTFDLIVGLGYQLKSWHFVAAIQQPLTQNNNQFLASAYPSSSGLRSFPNTNQFQRAGDVLLRISHPIRITKQFSCTPSLLPIYHLANDRFVNSSGVREDIRGSRGLTLNGNVYFDYAIGSQHALQLNIGAPFVVRDVRPDGLTRNFIANLEYQFKF